MIHWLPKTYSFFFLIQFMKAPPPISPLPSTKKKIPTPHPPHPTPPHQTKPNQTINKPKPNTKPKPFTPLSSLLPPPLSPFHSLISFPPCWFRAWRVRVGWWGGGGEGGGKGCGWVLGIVVVGAVVDWGFWGGGVRNFILWFEGGWWIWVGVDVRGWMGMVGRRGNVLRGIKHVWCTGGIWQIDLVYGNGDHFSFESGIKVVNHNLFWLKHHHRRWTCVSSI